MLKLPFSFRPESGNPHFALVYFCLLLAHGIANSQSCKPVSDENIKGAVTLQSGCVYSSEVTISESHTTLDCNGAMFDGYQKLSTGLRIESKHGSRLRDVRVLNCGFRNFRMFGVIIKPARAGLDPDISYDDAPHDIVIENASIENIGRVGIYVSEYVSRVTIRNSTIQQTGSTGIYLDRSSRDNRVIGTRLSRTGLGRPGQGPREALAIDSSVSNEIRDNIFIRNARGGVFLYKNCGERSSKSINPLRWQHSDRNQIMNNLFVDEEVGVWIASRQSANLSKWDCADKPMDSRGRYFEDFANDNIVSGNTFCNVAVGVRVEGDRNRITGNAFAGRVGKEIEIPATKRGALLGRPPRDNTVSSNYKGKCPTIQ